MDTASSSAQLPLFRDGAVGADWTLRESARSRRLTVRIHHGGRVEVVVPRGTARPMVLAFLRRHRQWIDRRREQAQRHARPVEPFPPSLLRLAGIGEQWRLHMAGGEGVFRVHALANGVLSVRGTGAAETLRACLIRWLVGHARTALGTRLSELAAETGLAFERVQIRRQRSRWGSCSTRGTISLNCALLFQPPEVLRYLLVHELVHTRHMNHSRAYWSAVARIEPDCRQLDRELLGGWRHVPAWLFAESGELH